MSNSAIITTERNYLSNGIGVYLHWNGGRDSVEGFLEYCKLKNYSSYSGDNLDFARLCQVIGNYFGGNGSIELNTINNLPKCDNGVYIVDNWEIVDRRDFNGREQRQYKLQDFLKDVDKHQPKNEKLGDFLDAVPTETKNIKIGDKVYIEGVDGNYKEFTVIGFGEDKENNYVNGTLVNNIPYVNRYLNDGVYTKNINNYLTEDNYRVVKDK